MLRDVPFLPSEGPSAGGVPVGQVIVTSDALAADFQALADRETRRGIPTVVRTVSWIESAYAGADTPARLRAFLRDAHDLWGTRWVVLGGDVEHVPTRYVPWFDEELPTDLYYECLDREWNEDGDAVFAEPLTTANLAGYVHDAAADAAGTIWAGTNLGVTRLEGGVFTHFDLHDGLPSVEVRDVEVATDGSVWVGTAAGVAVWDGSSAWTAHTPAQGLPSGEVLCLLARHAADVWVGTAAGLAHWDGIAWSSWTAADGLPSETITALADAGDAIWVGTFAGAARFAGGAFTVHDTSNSGLLSDQILSVAADGQGLLWFGHADNYFGVGGLTRFDGVTWTPDSLPAFGGLSVRSIALGPAPEELWAATASGLLHRSGAGDELLDEGDGLPGQELNAVTWGAGADLIVSAAEGLAVGSPGSWTVYTEGNGLPLPPLEYDDIDLFPDVALGRIPATDGAEVAAYLQKLVDYENGLAADRAETALLLGETLFHDSDGKEICEDVAAALPPSFQPTGLYEVDGTEGVDTVLVELDRGYGLIAHVGHGSYDVLGVGDDSPPAQLLFHSQLDAVDAGGRPALVLAYNCNSGGFDQDCSMEHLLFNPLGGAVATISNARASVPGVDAELNLVFLAKLFESSHACPTLAMHETREQLLAERPDALQLATWWRRVYLQRSYLGAPTLAFRRGVPAPLSVSHPALVPQARAPFPVTVARAGDGAPVAGALVCLSKGSEDYAYGHTDSTGALTFDFRPESAGSLTVVVSAPDCLPYEGSVPVGAASGANVVAESWERVTLAGLAPTELALRFALRNAGDPSGAGWTLQLASGDPRVTIVSGTGSLSALDTGQSDWSSPFVIDVDPSVADGEQFPLVLSGSGPSTFTESLRVTAEAPALALDGIVAAGQELTPRVTNRGTVASSVTAVLVSLDSLGTVIDGTGFAPSIAPGETALLPDGFLVSGPVASSFELRMTDDLGRTVTQPVDREAPAGAMLAGAEPLDGGALVTWLGSPSPDLAGYRVYGRDADGVWQDELGSLATGGARAEVSLAPGSSRELLVLAVDRTGNESADSCFVLAHAAPPLLPGWPQRLWSQVGPSPVTASDLDGDGISEILLGSLWEANAAHVFRVDGSEWTDGDADPRTNGIFGRTAGRVVAAPLAADLDGDGACEIYSGSYDGLLHGWRTDGVGGQPPGPLPGYPLPLASSAIRSTPVAGDLDGDGEAELVVVEAYKRVHAIERDGAPLPGWPRTTGQGGLGTTPAVHDLNHDGLDDVVFGGTDSLLYVVSGDGVDLPGWPVHVGARVQSSPVLADADGDGELEIFALARDGRIHAYRWGDTDGTPGADPLPGWPAAMAPPTPVRPSPAVADLDGDGLPEIVVNGDGELAVFRPDGSPFPGTPIATGAAGECSPAIADLDGDGTFEILFSTSAYRLHAVRPDGSPAPGWPRRFSEIPKATPWVADVDADGDLDVVIGADDARVLVVDVAGRAVPGAVPWPGYHGADFRGVFASVPYSPTGEPGPRPPALPVRLRLDPPAPNPFRGATELRFALPAAGPVRLEVVDVRGRRVVSLAPGGPLPAGTHVVTWDGRDTQGRSAASGVYFLRLETAGGTQTRKVLRLR